MAGRLARPLVRRRPVSQADRPARGRLAVADPLVAGLAADAPLAVALTLALPTVAAAQTLTEAQAREATWSLSLREGLQNAPV